MGKIIDLPEMRDKQRVDQEKRPLNLNYFLSSNPG